MKVFIVLVVIGASLPLAYNINKLENRIVELETNDNRQADKNESLKQQLLAVNELAKSRTHELQDSFEERLGTLERQVDDIRFVQPKGKQK